MPHTTLLSCLAAPHCVVLTSEATQLSTVSTRFATPHFGGSAESKLASAAARGVAQAAETASTQIRKTNFFERHLPITNRLNPFLSKNWAYILASAILTRLFVGFVRIGENH